MTFSVLGLCILAASTVGLVAAWGLTTLKPPIAKGISAIPFLAGSGAAFLFLNRHKTDSSEIPY